MQVRTCRALTMPLSIKQKQVLGVTTIVVLVVIGLVGCFTSGPSCAFCFSRRRRAPKWWRPA